MRPDCNLRQIMPQKSTVMDIQYRLLQEVQILLRKTKGFPLIFRHHRFNSLETIVVIKHKEAWLDNYDFPVTSLKIVAKQFINEPHVYKINLISTIYVSLWEPLPHICVCLLSRVKKWRVFVNLRCLFCLDPVEGRRVICFCKMSLSEASIFKCLGLKPS